MQVSTSHDTTSASADAERKRAANRKASRKWRRRNTDQKEKLFATIMSWIRVFQGVREDTVTKPIRRLLDVINE